MRIIKLFLSFFNFVLFIFTNRKRLIHVLYMLSLAVQALTRALKQKGIRVSFEPHEKGAGLIPAKNREENRFPNLLKSWF
jgi:hypothetical protein